MSFALPHFLSVKQINSIITVEVFFTLARNIEMLLKSEKSLNVLKEHILASLFFEPSTRTRMSFSSAFYRLGGKVIDFTPDSSSIKKGESIEDTSRMISSYADIAVIRHPQQGQVNKFANVSNIPVINAGDGSGEHPTQALLDLYTIFKEMNVVTADALKGMQLTMVGDLKYGRAVHSLCSLLCLMPALQLHFIAPEPLRLPPELKEQLIAAGHSVYESEELKPALQKSQVVYMTRIQEERFPDPEEAKIYQGAYSINQKLWQEYASPEAILMHPLPRNSQLNQLEIETDMDNHPKLAMFRQSANGVPIRMGLFVQMLGGEDILL